MARLSEYFTRAVEEIEIFEGEDKKMVRKNVAIMFFFFQESLIKYFLRNPGIRIMVSGVGTFAFNSKNKTRLMRTLRKIQKYDKINASQIPDIDETRLPERERALLKELKRDRANLYGAKKRAKNTDG